jgi:hypothetical protein
MPRGGVIIHVDNVGSVQAEIDAIFFGHVERLMLQQVCITRTHPAFGAGEAWYGSGQEVAVGDDGIAIVGLRTFRHHEVLFGGEGKELAGLQLTLRAVLELLRQPGVIKDILRDSVAASVARPSGATPPVVLSV